MLIAYREPFDPFSVKSRTVSADMTLRQMAEAVPVPPDFWEYGIAVVDGDVTRDFDQVPDGQNISLHLRPMGGGGEGGKNGLALVASIALLGGVGFISGGGLQTALGFGSAFAQG
ncbi:MAG: hypothetical protein AAFY43_07380, partial [Pseudomonadota bacterium]